MSSFENRGDTRRINDFGSRESSNRIDALPDMAKWFENEAAARAHAGEKAEKTKFRNVS